MIYSITKLALLSVAFLSFLGFQSIFAQQPEGDGKISDMNAAILIDRYGKIGSEDRSVRIDQMFFSTESRPGSVGQIVLYCGKACFYGEIEAHMRGINDKIRARGRDPRSFSIIFGGYHEEFTVEMWIIPKNAASPVPTPSIKIEGVDFIGIYPWKLEPYDCCDGYEENEQMPVYLPHINGIPKQIISFLESVPTFEILMQTRLENEKPIAKIGMNYQPNLQKTIKDKTTRKRLLKSLYSASKTESVLTTCYLPGHSIKATDGNKSIEIEISFYCRRYLIRGDLGHYVGSLEYESKAEAEFTDYLLKP